jgi:predicted nucleic acid-binding protein
MYRSKIGMVTLKNVKTQLSAIFGFVCKGRDKYKPKNKEQILDEMCPKKLSCRIAVEGFLKKIRKHFKVENLNKSQQAALCYKFQEEINYHYLNARFYYHNDVAGKHKFLRQERFRDLCLLFWEIEEENTLKRNKCLRLMDKFGEDPNDKAVWESMKEFR